MPRPDLKKLRALAIHLTETGVHQKALFDASAKRLPYVECIRRTAALSRLHVRHRRAMTWIDDPLTGLRTVTIRLYLEKVQAERLLGRATV